MALVQASRGWGSVFEMTHQYTPEEDAAICRGKAEGISTAKIGVSLRLTKGMVIGRCRTLGLEKKPPDRSSAKKRRRLANPKPKPLPSMAVVFPQIAAQLPPRQRADVEEVLMLRRCTFLPMDRRPWIYCDAPCTTRPGLGGEPVWQSFCEKHQSICYKRSAAQ